MKSQSATVLLALATMATAPDAKATTPEASVSSITHDRLPPGQQFVIETDDQVYRGHLLDQRTGECQMMILKNGVAATPSRTVYLLGATAGPQDRQTLVLMHQVKVGLKMELGLDDLDQRNRVTTGAVRSIKLVR